jgi:hypothetical protein
MTWRVTTEQCRCQLMTLKQGDTQTMQDLSCGVQTMFDLQCKIYLVVSKQCLTYNATPIQWGAITTQYKWLLTVVEEIDMPYANTCMTRRVTPDRCI